MNAACMEDGPRRLRSLDGLVLRRTGCSFACVLPCVVLLASGCRSAAEPKVQAKPADELVVPKMPAEAGVLSAVTTRSAADAGAPAEVGGDGWMVQPEKGSAPSYTKRALVVEAIRKAAHRALLVHDAHLEDCSSIGGSHAFFTVVEPAKGVAYYGGRGTHVGGFEPGQHWVASIEPLSKPVSVKDKAACIPDRTIDAKVTALVPVTSKDDGVRLLEELAR